MPRKTYVIGLLAVLAMAVFFFSAPVKQVSADCHMPGNNHGDWNPSESKAKKLINSGASVCELAQKCDSGQIEIKIKNADQMHQMAFYKNAPGEIQDELDEYIQNGHGHDNPNMVCYEIEEAVHENN